MPRFNDAGTGQEIYVAPAAVLVARAGQGGLTTQMLTLAGPIEVSGTFDSVIKDLETALVLAGASGWSTVGGAQ